MNKKITIEYNYDLSDIQPSEELQRELENHALQRVFEGRTNETNLLREGELIFYDNETDTEIYGWFHFRSEEAN